MDDSLAQERCACESLCTSDWVLILKTIPLTLYAINLFWTAVFQQKLPHKGLEAYSPASENTCAMLISSMYKIVKIEIRYESKKNNQIKYFPGK